jgi:ligand-binding sensor domain-containing protein
VNQVASDGRRVLVRFSNGQVYTQIGRERFRQLGAGDGWPKNWTSAAGSSQGQLWAGTQNAFYLRTPEGWQIRAPKPQLQEKLILDLEVDGSVRWLATHRQGLLRWDTEGDDWNQYSLGSGLDDTWVTCLARFRGEIWAGTFSGGLARLPVGERDPRAWRRIRHDDPKGLLPSDGIQCLLETPHGLWIGTFEGLVWTDGEYWKTFGLETGLPSKNILSLTTGDGRLWVGTDSGLARANLEDLR